MFWSGMWYFACVMFCSGMGHKMFWCEVCCFGVRCDVLVVVSISMYQYQAWVSQCFQQERAIMSTSHRNMPAAAGEGEREERKQERMGKEDWCYKKLGMGRGGIQKWDAGCERRGMGRRMQEEKTETWCKRKAKWKVRMEKEGKCETRGRWRDASRKCMGTEGKVEKK